MNQEYKQFLDFQIDKIKHIFLNYEGHLSYKEAMDIIENSVFESGIPFGIEECEDLIQRIYAKTRSKLGILDLYINNDQINEVMINGPNNFFYEDKTGIKHIKDSFDSTNELEEIIRNIAADVHREINEMNPILDARLQDGSRVNAVYKNIAVDGPVLTIRKFSKDRITIEQMIEFETLSVECAQYLKNLVECGYNIFVSGGTSSGKTTFLNALTDYVPKGERVIVIEDSRELQLDNIENLVQMECHNANSQGKGQVTMDMLIKSSLRMRPDRIIVGEVRGSEVASMLQGLNTGHDGSMSTGHGNSVSGMLRRLEAMYLMASQIPMDAIRAQIVEGIDIMVHLGRLPGGQRRVLEIQEILDYDQGKYILNNLFYLNKDRKIVYSGNKLVNCNKLLLKGNQNGNRL